MHPLHRFATSALVALMRASLGLPHARAVTIAMVTVGDPGNANDVTGFGAARFANWMHNGAISDASTETGAYTLNGATSGVGFTKNAGATWWIPSENEWSKAAYYKGGGTNAGHWLFPFQSDGSLGNSIGGEPGQANYYDGDDAVTQLPTSSQSQNYLTDAGEFRRHAGRHHGPAGDSESADVDRGHFVG